MFLLLQVILFNETRVTERLVWARQFARSWGDSRVEKADMHKVTPNHMSDYKLWLKTQERSLRGAFRTSKGRTCFNLP